jgi:tRNA1Val (adenine37-N6)-methyltransferase
MMTSNKQQQQQQQEQQRYIPATEATSLSSDAPGYGLEGPICWKCRGDGSGGVRRRMSNHHSHHERDSSVDCPVCKGTGRRPIRQIDAASIPGKITRGRRYRRIVPGEPPTSSYHGPDPIGYDVPIFGAMVKRATIECVDIIVDSFIDTNDNHSSSNPSSNSTNDERSSVCSVHNSTTTTTTMATPVWMPQYPTEELCNLTGHWRILQRVGSHRWTTDDLVTAMAAAREIMVVQGAPSYQNHPHHHSGMSYCDLGTGNASVLQMLLWKVLGAGIPVDGTIGLEARAEAVALARRSLVFNLGDPPSVPVSIIHTDFRSYCQENATLLHHQFDLVTGTPPYFRVDFHVQHDDDHHVVPVVHTATIRQGGMPTSIQSAPARCEFRGGFEEYCAAAKILLKPRTGIFCVCENYLNHERAMAAFITYGLVLVKLYKVEGKIGRGTLFCVYVLRKITEDSPEQCLVPTTTIEFAVRDLDGNWTKEYTNIVVDFMSVGGTMIES